MNKKDTPGVVSHHLLAPLNLGNIRRPLSTMLAEKSGAARVVSGGELHVSSICKCKTYIWKLMEVTKRDAPFFRHPYTMTFFTTYDVVDTQLAIVSGGSTTRFAASGRIIYGITLV